MPVSRLLRIPASCQKASMTARGGRGGSATGGSWAALPGQKWMQLEHRSCINGD